MELAYIVKAHKNPAQVKRMVSRLHAEGTCFLFTIDRKAGAKPFQREMARLPSHIPCHWVLPSREGAWGGAGLVHSSLDALEMALGLPAIPAQIFQISGQCYPIKPISAIMEYFRSLQGKCLMQCLLPPIPSWPGGGWLRIQKYHYWLPSWLPFDRHRREFPLDAPPSTVKERILQRFLARRFPLPREFPAGLSPYFGHAFWSMTPAMARFILDFHARRPEVLDFHRHTLIADEIYFQSIVGSSEKWRAQVTNTRQHYCDWSKPVHPAILTMEHAEELRKTPWLMARKFDADIDSQILDWIDENLLNQ